MCLTKLWGHVSISAIPCGDTVAIKDHSATVSQRCGSFFHVAINKLVDKVTPLVDKVTWCKHD